MPKLRLGGPFDEQVTLNAEEYKNVVKVPIYKKGGEVVAYAIVSKCDGQAKNIRWRLNSDGYPIADVSGKTIKMSHYIMEVDKGVSVDHKDGNRLDHRRGQLRIVTAHQNAQNRHKKKGASSEYYGVYFHTRTKKWHTRVRGKNACCLGYFESEIEAAEAYDMWTVHGQHEFRKLNFPENLDKYKEKEYTPPRVWADRKKCDYKGVRIAGKKFQAKICIDGKHINLGRFDEPEEAAREYDRYIAENMVPKKMLNFPDEWPEYDPRVILTQCEDVDENTVRLIINSKTYEDPRALVDRDDYEKVIKYHTCFIHSGLYVGILTGGANRLLHRYLLGITDPRIYVDHKNNNGFDDRRKNLRLSDASTNCRNKVKKDKCSSSFINVSKCIDNKYRCTIKIDGKLHSLGRHHDDEVLARKRDLYIMRHLSDQHYKLNFTWATKEKKEWKMKVEEIWGPDALKRIT